MSEDRFQALVTRAFLTLSEEERSVVLAELVRRGAQRPRATAVHGQVGKLEEVASPTFLQAQPPAAADQVSLLVRLDRQQHEQLKLWCAQHQFSIATVIRGLVSRFLDGQEQTPATKTSQ